MEYKPSPYVSWIKHLDDYNDKNKVISLMSNCTEILVHPCHKPLSIESESDVYQALDKEDKTIQLYFYSLAWIIPVLESSDCEKIIAALQIIHKVLDITPEEERMGAWNMLWDDHAICERSCVLLEIRKYCDALNLDNNLSKKIDAHIDEIQNRLNSFIKDDKWANNNHRIFHLLAAFINSDSNGDLNRKEELRFCIADFINSLMDRDTGFALEQCIAYCFFDLIVIKNVIETMSLLSAELDFDVGLIEKNMNAHMASLSFPDGTLPASGDTTLGRNLSGHQKKFTPEPNQLVSYWERLDKIGYFRGRANDDSVHFLTLSHNAESAHGHFSPLHTDVWFQDFGCLIVDSGGPYKYGSKLRYNWFKAANGHNSLAIKNNNHQDIVDISLVALINRTGFVGHSKSKSSNHLRSIFTYSDTIIIHESITSDSDWSLYYNFSESCELRQVQDGVFEITKSDCINKIIIRLTIDNTDINIIETERCVGHSKIVKAPSLVVSSSINESNFFFVCSKVSC
ncbi:heparinase II/III family protein [Microbulbifer sp. DLAB2-AF]|uniref:heparinase II/III domain-containing protein n=1 Tax=Microbulbifer sp. DLAB2-AF TaxID=3243395 RepID=UPI00403A5D00